MRAVALASGSNGNAIWVETSAVRLLFDAGVSGRLLEERGEARGVDLRSADALVLSHDHTDHTRGAGVVHRRYRIPVHATRDTWGVVGPRVGRVRDLRLFRGGEALRFGDTVVHTVPTPHDGVDGCAFLVEESGVRLGILTDLGHPFAGLDALLRTLDAAFLEANHDEEMLETGPYPRALKDRIRGPGGHLSNRESVSLALEASSARLRQVVLCHLSGENNTPGRVRRTARPLGGRGVHVHIAGRHAAGDWLLL